MRNRFYIPDDSDTERDNFNISDIDDWQDIDESYFTVDPNGSINTNDLRRRGDIEATNLGMGVEPDNLFGRNKAKKAEKKLRKAQKQLAKGHIKKAEKKLAKAEKIQGALGAAQSQLGADIKTQQDINATAANLNTMSTAANESQQTQAGQIGLAAMPTTNTPNMAQASMPETGSSGGGGGGYMDTSDSSMSDTSSMANPSDEPTGTLAGTKTLDNVTVTAHKTNIALVIGVIIAAAVIIYFLSKKKK